MKKKFVALCLVATVVIIIMSVHAEACYSDFDCGIGGKCIKSSGDMQGACTNPYDNTEKRGPGKQCYSNMDCGIGGDCIK